MKVSSCRECGGCGVLQIGDAFAKMLPEFWIDLYRCEQYVLCMRCAGIGVILVEEPRYVEDYKKADRMVLDAPVDGRLVEILSAMPRARLSRIMSEVRA